MKNNEAINIEEKEQEVRYAKNSLYALVGFTILGGILIDPWHLVDAAFLAILAIIVTLKDSKTTLLIACIYYLIDSIIAFLEFDFSGAGGWFLRAAINYFLIKGAISAYQLDKAKKGLIASFTN